MLHLCNFDENCCVLKLEGLQRQNECELTVFSPYVVNLFLVLFKNRQLDGQFRAQNGTGIDQAPFQLLHSSLNCKKQKARDQIATCCENQSNQRGNLYFILVEDLYPPLYSLKKEDHNGKVTLPYIFMAFKSICEANC